MVMPFLPPQLLAPQSFDVFRQVKCKSMTMSTITISYRSIALLDCRGRRSWHQAALLAEVWDEPEAPKADRAFARCGEGWRVGSNHRDDVVAVDGAGQSAQTRCDPALQAAGRAVLGGIRPGGLAGAAAADERDPAGGSGRHGQGADQPGAGGTGLAQAGREGGQSAGQPRDTGLPDQGRAGGA